MLINYIGLQTTFGVRSISDNSLEVSSAVYLQVSIISQALIFVTRSQGFSFLERPGTLLMIAFVVAQLVWLKQIKMFYLIIHLHIFTSWNAFKRNVVSNQLLHVCIKLDYKGHRTQQCYILFVVSLIFRWLLWLPSMHKSALLTLVALDGDGLESYGCIVWFSTFPWTLSNSQFAIAWVEMPGICCLIERYCNVLSCNVLLYYQSNTSLSED